MDDLTQLNRRIAEHWLGQLNANQNAYLSYVSVCLGELPYDAGELADVLTRSKQDGNDPLVVAKLNLQYLTFARLAAKDVAAGKFDMLIKLGLTVQHAEMLAKLTDEDISRLAFVWDGPIIRFASQAFTRGAALHLRAAKHHASAYVATRSPIKNQ